MAISLGFFSLQNFRLHKQKSPKLKHLKFQHILARHRNPLRLQEALKERKNTKHYKKLGRKAKFNNAEIQAIKMTRLQGKSYREIARQFDCSVGIVHKIINEQQNKK